MEKIQSYAVLKCYKESQIIVFNKRNSRLIFRNFTIPEQAESSPPEILSNSLQGKVLGKALWSISFIFMYIRSIPSSTVHASFPI